MLPVTSVGFFPELSKGLMIEVRSMSRNSPEAAEAARVKSIRYGAMAVKLEAATITDMSTLRASRLELYQ